MNRRSICILVILIQAAVLKGKAEVNAPPYPPQQWGLRVTFTFSRDVLLTFVDAKPNAGESLIPGMLFLWLSDDCEIRGHSSHPVLRRKLSEDGSERLGFEAIGYVPQVDQRAVYSNACRVLDSFRYANSFAHTNYDASGIDISIDLEINGRSMSVKYDKLQAKDAPPDDIASLLALLRRNLSSAYGGLFDRLHVTKLPPLTGDSADHYRRCQLHNEWMKVGDASIVYGLPSVDQAYSHAENQCFPNANIHSFSGCMSEPDGPKGEKCLYCESCRKAESDWRKKSEKKP